MNISEELDRSFGEGPPLPPPADLLVPARRALARRRALTGAAAGVAALVMVGVALLGTQGEPANVAPVGPATEPTDTIELPPTVTPEPPPPSDDGGSPDAWPGIPDLDLVRFTDGDRLAAVDGVTLVRQRARPDLGPSWAGPGDRSAAAEVLLDDGRYYVLARRSDAGPAQYIAVREADGGPNLQAFLVLARERYAEGGGGFL